MICNNIRSMTSEYLDDHVLNDDRAEIETHLRHCAGCVQHFEVRRRDRINLRRLPAYVPPAHLAASLRMVAAQHSATIAQGGFNWRDRLSLVFRNLMRPFAVPAMGGLVSAVVLFSMIMPNIAIHSRGPMSNDVPTGFFTDASAKYSAPLGLAESEMVFDLVVDPEGRVVTFTAVTGSELLSRDSSLKRQIENKMLFTEFTPATFLGSPTSGRIRVKMTSENITIRG